MICYQESGAGALTKIREMLLAGVPVLANAHACRSYDEYRGAGLVEFADLGDLDRATADVLAAGEVPASSAGPRSDAIARAGQELLRRLKELIKGHP